MFNKGSKINYGGQNTLNNNKNIIFIKYMREKTLWERN